VSIAEEKAKTESKPSEDLQLQTIPEVRERIANLVKSNAIGMVQKTIELVNVGHYAAMKYLFEMIGLFPAPPLEESPEEDSLARTLLRGLGLSES
jgi:hypothetical protein